VAVSKKSPPLCERRFKEMEAGSPILLAQDYHFALLPRMVRRHGPMRAVAIFWHIPWPNAEVFGICPCSEN